MNNNVFSACVTRLIVAVRVYSVKPALIILLSLSKDEVIWQPVFVCVSG